MVQRTEIERYVRNMVAFDIMEKPLSSLGDRVKRRKEKAAKEIADLLKEGEEKEERIFVRIEKLDEEKARTLKEGIDEFSNKYPKYGKILNDLIEEKRTRKNKYLIFGLNEGYRLGVEDYIRVMIDIGFTREEAGAVYPHIKEAYIRLKLAKSKDKKPIEDYEKDLEKEERSILL
ncbi:MAG: hypothetical protein AB1571_02470 [Nanoarchaeota archaeon]